MADFELFTAGEAGEGFDPKALEQFREQMRKNAAALAALQKSEQKQKKTEDKLAKILAKFIKTSTRDSFVRLIVLCLEENMPAVLILNVVLLGNEDLQKETGIEIKLLADKRHEEAESGKEIVPFSFKDESLPLKLKIEVDAWISEIMRAAESEPHKVLKTVRGRDGEIKEQLKNLFSRVLLEFLEKEKQSIEANILIKFSEFVIKGILNKVEKDLKARKEIKEKA